MNQPQDLLTAEMVQKMDAYWRAANYLSVGQIYLRDNPLLRQALAPGHIKHLLLGHWGTGELHPGRILSMSISTGLSGNMTWI
ncbi:hypothetical protein GCM10011511_10150 [Puia dinghuensis]|uniref:Xylulose 5-phosphate/Fructose 6-phosphate phosphoketolase N-terminal domain-containing protein n=2 Tax=Puia dinghuensis TaxID=1792502 RepID=A0A8J2U9S1_9BACT|nr:hypothetical protein GCM10011511_10150 [Puia dinghuensis]